MGNSRDKRDATAELLAGVAEGDQTAFKALYDLHAARLLGVLLKLVRNQADAEDLLQTVYVTVWNRADKYDPRLGKGISWMVVIARNAGLDFLRKHTRRKALLEEQLEEAPSASSAFANTLDATLLQNALSNLPSDQREPIELAFLSGFSHREISEQMKTPLGTVKARIRRGLQRLNEELDGKEWLQS